MYSIVTLPHWCLVSKSLALQEQFVEAQLKVEDSVEYDGDNMTWNQDVYGDVSSKETTSTCYMDNNVDNDNDDLEALLHSFLKYFKSSVHVYIQCSSQYFSHLYNNRNTTIQSYDRQICLQ